MGLEVWGFEEPRDTALIHDMVVRATGLPGSAHGRIVGPAGVFPRVDWSDNWFCASNSQRQLKF
jgi:hypothetical protein